jgi:hypothetical protein
MSAGSCLDLVYRSNTGSLGAWPVAVGRQSICGLSGRARRSVARLRAWSTYDPIVAESTCHAHVSVRYRTCLLLLRGIETHVLCVTKPGQTQCGQNLEGSALLKRNMIRCSDSIFTYRSRGAAWPDHAGIPDGAGGPTRALGLVLNAALLSGQPGTWPPSTTCEPCRPRSASMTSWTRTWPGSPR